MERSVHLYNAFTGINPAEKSFLLHFFANNGKNVSPSAVLQAVDYALKNRPSFGGFIFMMLENERIIGAVVVNKTGMEGIRSENLLLLAEVHNQYRTDETIWHELISRAVQYADGDISFTVPSHHPALAIAKKMGFQDQFIELRFQPQKATVAI
jgi:[ribosomal protein S18]-alanine N-acetyltransferase